MKRLDSAKLAGALVLLASTPFAHAAFHLWDINEIFSNADGSVQFIELFCPVDGQQFLMNHDLNATSDGDLQNFVFPTDSGAPTANQFLLLATPGFELLPGGVNPDYTIPPGFFDPNATTITLDFGPGQDMVTFSSTDLPVDGMTSLNPDLTTGVNSPTNFNGDQGSVDVPVDLIFADSLETP